MTAKKNEESTSTALAIPESTALVDSQYGDDAGQGNDARPEDYLLPLLYTLQALSPQVAKEGEMIEGARPGMFYDGSTDQLYDGKEGLILIPCFRNHCYVEWTPRQPRDDGSTGTGSGKGRTFKVDDPIVAKCEKTRKEMKRKYGDLRLPDTDNNLDETIYLYALAVMSYEPARFAPVVFPITSTKLSAFKKWNGKRLRFRTDGGEEPPFYAHHLRLCTFQDENSSGQPFYNITLTPTNGQYANSLLPQDHELYLGAKTFRKQVVEGLFSLDEDSEANQYQGSKTGVEDGDVEASVDEDDPLF